MNNILGYPLLRLRRWPQENELRIRRLTSASKARRHLIPVEIVPSLNNGHGRRSLGLCNRNGHQGIPSASPLPLPRIARRLWPRQSRGPGECQGMDRRLAHRLWGACGCWRSDRGDGDGKGSRDSGWHSTWIQNRPNPITGSRPVKRSPTTT